MTPLLVGTYTERLGHVDGHGEGIVGVCFDEATGAFGTPTTFARAVNPSYLAADPRATRVYAVNETDANSGAGGVTAFSRNAAGSLTLLNTVPSGGPFPAHVCVDAKAEVVYAANYGGSLAAFCIEESGLVGPLRVREYGAFPSAHPRQNGSHPHQATRVGDELLVCDLGAGRIWVHDLADGSVLNAPRYAVELGTAGPRHLVAHPDGRHIAVCNELESSVTLLRRGGDGRFHRDGTHTTRDGGGGGTPNLAGAIIASADDDVLFVTNRGDDSIAMFTWTGPTLELVDVHPLEGRTPRDAAIVSGHVIVACQDSDLVECHAFDNDAMTLTRLSAVEIRSPACVLAITPQSGILPRHPDAVD